MTDITPDTDDLKDLENEQPDAELTTRYRVVLVKTAATDARLDIRAYTPFDAANRAEHKQDGMVFTIRELERLDTITVYDWYTGEQLYYEEK